MSHKSYIHKILGIAAIAAGIASCGTQKSITGFKDRQAAVSGSAVKKSQSSSVPFSDNTTWNNIEYKGEPWVRNVSQPFSATRGLQNRHIAVWASHGRYYDNNKDTWKWQRPLLFGTTEDLFTQTIVVPYLIPMLERAGANVFTPRERDWQKNEIIVDNDDKIRMPYYMELNINRQWQDARVRGFARHHGTYRDNENPFEAGTARMAKAVKSNGSEISYQPSFTTGGRYAVYVSYPTLEKSVSDARYTIFHKGQRTEFRVNQRMGGGTWVYLGTFDFDAGCNEYNRVTLTNTSNDKGYVTADAVRFGGGMGNIERGGYTSGLPRCLEGARYYAQWAGAPYEVYSSKNGQDDYGDDINVRSLMTNWLAGGSCYVPDETGKGVPIELSLAVHSDAGFCKDSQGLIGSLSICTTDFNNGKLRSGISRQASKNFATQLLYNVENDIRFCHDKWAIREIYDRNYSETRLPAVPSAILETMSHQNFPDMMMGQDPNFRFTLARSIYKTILKYVSKSHGRKFVVTPLAPRNFSVELNNGNEAVLQWDPEPDLQEPSARPDAYVVYVSAGTGGFDNGTKVNSCSYKIRLEPGVLYNFKVTAVNSGGESFPSETLSAVYNEGAAKSILIVNGFHRLSAPAAINTETEQGFDFDADPGVSYGHTAGWSGKQICYDKTKMGIEGPDGLGYSGTEWQGMFIAGNDFDNVRTHTEALMSNRKYNISSASRQAVETGKLNIMKYHGIDLILGLEKYETKAMKYYKTFTPAMQKIITEYSKSGGAIFISGSFIGSDMKSDKEMAFLQNILKLNYGGNERNNKDTIINGMGTSFDIYRTVNEKHYAAISPEILLPSASAFSSLTYSDGMSACVAYDGTDYRSFTMGFPFECIKDARKRSAVMSGIMYFLLK